MKNVKQIVVQFGALQSIRPTWDTWYLNRFWSANLSVHIFKSNEVVIILFYFILFIIFIIFTQFSIS